MADNKELANRNTVTSYGRKEDDTSKNNPRNEQSPLYIALTRLFSGPLANYRNQSQVRFKRRDLDRFKFTSASGQTFKKKSYNPFESIQSNVMANQTRAERYSDFDQMEFMPELASALDIYADEMTTSNQFKQLLNIDCKNQEIKEVLHDLFYKILNVEQNLYSWCRTLIKYGDLFLYLDIDEKLGVKNFLCIPSPEIERLEGQDETNPNYVQFQWNTAGMTFENWQVAHFRVLGQDKYAPYGTSALEPARRIWRQLQLIEDAMMAYRIVRSPERRVFYIDVGNVAPQEVEQYVQRIITQMKRNQIVDPTTGRVDLRYNPMSVDEDFYIPVRGQNSGTKIESLPGGQFTSAIDDVKYLRDKLFSAIKIPQAYLARGEGAAEDKTMLAQKDIRFARTIQRLQRIVISELQKIAILHLYTLGFRNQDLLKFSLKLHNPSKLAELQELEHFKAQLEIAGSAKENGFSKRWIFENIFKMNDHDFLRIQRDLSYDAAFNKAIQAGDEAGGAAGGGGGGIGDLGGGLSAGAGTLPEMGGGPAGAPGAAPPVGGSEAGAPAAEAPAGGESSAPEASANPLLAAPARREDIFKLKKPHVTQGSKGKWYTPVASDGRASGQRSRSQDALWSKEFTKNSNRNVYKGLDTLARGIFEEEKIDLFERDEKMLLDVEYKLKLLSEKLNIGDKKDET